MGTVHQKLGVSKCLSQELPIKDAETDMRIASLSHVVVRDP